VLARNPHRTYKSWLFLFVLTFFAAATLPKTAHAQGLELSGGWAHITSDFGTDGYNVGSAYWFTNEATPAANYDAAWDTSSLSNFAFTQVGGIAVHSHLQNLLVGPRIFFGNKWVEKHHFQAFGEAQFGVSELQQKVSVVTQPTVSASDKAFSWMLGAGGDYVFSPHWSGRVNLDFLRTHLANAGQSRLRLALALTYTLGERSKKK